jgi:hypothetical protein
MLVEYESTSDYTTDYSHKDPKRNEKERTRNDEGNRKWTRKRITKTANEN